MASPFRLDDMMMDGYDELHDTKRSCMYEQISGRARGGYSRWVVLADLLDAVENALIDDSPPNIDTKAFFSPMWRRPDE